MKEKHNNLLTYLTHYDIVCIIVKEVQQWKIIKNIK